MLSMIEPESSIILLRAKPALTQEIYVLAELTKRSPRSKTNVTTVLSKDPDASRFPSQFHATECTLEECT